MSQLTDELNLDAWSTPAASPVSNSILPPTTAKIRPEHNIHPLFFEIRASLSVNCSKNRHPDSNETDYILPGRARNLSKETMKPPSVQLSDFMVKNSVSLEYHAPQDILPFQLLITEFMPDPLPAVGLPASEFIELFNATDHPLDLTDLKLQFESNAYTMDTTGLWIDPGDYLILCEKMASNQFSAFGRVHGLTRWPALRNTGGSLSLVYHDKVIHDLNYGEHWYRSTQKKNGGWSLEMISTLNVCDGALNWKASEAKEGGSPGRPNAVADNAYTINWSMDSLVVLDDYTIRCQLNKRIVPVEADSLQILPETGSLVVKTEPVTGSVEIKSSSPFKSGIVYQLTMKAKNCAGEWATHPLLAQFVKNEIIQYQDLIINEILFNPRAGGYDYVEVFNPSEKAISPEGWIWSNEYNGQKRKINANGWILPGQYLVFTSDPVYIWTDYVKVNRKWVIQQILPALPDESGQLTLYSPDGMIIDSMNYRENDHSPALTSREGVALERIGPYRPGIRARWHSASGLEGYGTPTRVNSSIHAESDAEYFKLKQKIFTPNDDGNEDYMALNYALPSRDYLSRIYIYNDRGKLIKRLVDHLILGFQGRIEWDGKDENNQRCQSGIYIIEIEALALNGRSIKSRLATILALQ